jgi:hypothetical protein
MEKSEFILMCKEGDELLRDEMIAYLAERYESNAVIVPGVIKRTN